MRSNYKRIGDLVKQIKLKNQDSEYDQLLGINIDKFFMPSVANIVGTDLSKYKVVSKYQFACNRMHVGRDGRIPIALSLNEIPFLVSPAYTVFEIIDSGVLPEYMMMWFRRPEFDRECCFHTDADVRGGLPWDLFCDIELPIPSIEKQRQIVAEYNTVVNRIKLNEQLNQKLEETAQALYKHWFVDFEFPISAEQAATMGKPNLEGKPYKSSGGKMMFNAELDKEIPEGWVISELSEVIDYFKGYAFKSSSYTQEGLAVVRVSDLTKRSIEFKDCFYIDQSLKDNFINVALNTNDIIITSVGSWPSNPDSVVGKVIRTPLLNRTAFLNQNMVCVRSKSNAFNPILYFALADENYSDYIISGAQGSANQASVTLKHLFSYQLIIPCAWRIKTLSTSFDRIISYQNIHNYENEYLVELKELLLSKMTQVEPEKETA